MMLRQERKISKEFSLYEPIGTDKEGNEIHLLDIIEGTDIDIADACIYKENVKTFLFSGNHVCVVV